MKLANYIFGLVAAASSGTSVYFALDYQHSGRVGLSMLFWVIAAINFRGSILSELSGRQQ